jgi:hypothetical protein
MGIFESGATRRGRKKGELQRIIHITSGQPLWSGKKLIDEARDYAVNSFYHEDVVTNKKTIYVDRYMKAFLLTYTSSQITSTSDVKDSSPQQEMDVRYDEERK